MSRNSEPTEIKLYCHAVTTKAVLVSESQDDDNKNWIAISQVEFPIDPPSRNSYVDIIVPAWILEKNGYMS